VCDETLHAAPNVVAAGDVANWPNPMFANRRMRIEHWANAVEQGSAAGRSLVRGAAAAPFASVPSFWSDHFDVRLQSVGVPAWADEFRVTDGEPDEGRFAAAAYRDGTLVGAIAYAMPRAMIRHRAAIVAGSAIAEPLSQHNVA
jgi:3-phenylpropionate/trans-cinnamate dioxygenase ferredoxin reductase subunit